MAATAGALTLASLSSGDAFLLAVLLGLAATDVVGGTAAGLVAVAVLGRWGSSSLAALAGAQAVLGPAGAVGPLAMVVSTWLAALALVAAAPGGGAGCAFGLAAALVAVGPAAAGPADAAVRLAAAAVGVAVVLRAAPRVPAGLRRRLALLAGAASAALAVLA